MNTASDFVRSENPTTSCPCIDPNNFSSFWRDKGTTFANATCEDPHFGVVSPSNSSLCNVGYGALSCQAWDEDIQSKEIECSALNEDRPGYCSAKWCYVDPANCNAPHAVSSFYAAQGLHYSYEACGYLDEWCKARDDCYFQEIKKTLGNKIRVSFPSGDSDSGYTLVTNPVTGDRKGSVVELVHRMLNIPEHNISVAMDLRPVSLQSQERHPQSSFTACVQDIALGKTDLCIANFWQTTQVSTPAHVLTLMAYISGEATIVLMPTAPNRSPDK